MFSLTEYLKNRLVMWGNRRHLFENSKYNKLFNWLIFIFEVVMLVWILSSVISCPCAVRTCGMKFYDCKNGAVNFEANNLDCSYVKDYINPKIFNTP